MDDNLEVFNSLEELYSRILPALNAKVAELKRMKINYINNKDIWNYCKNNKWSVKKNLKIYEMVNDIFDADLLELQLYIRKYYKGD